MTDATKPTPARIPTPNPFWRPRAIATTLLIYAAVCFLSYRDKPLEEAIQGLFIVFVGMGVFYAAAAAAYKRDGGGSAVLAVSVLLGAACLPSPAMANFEASGQDSLPASCSIAPAGLGFGDDPPAEWMNLPAVAGIPCSLMRMQDDFQGYMNGLWTLFIGGTISSKLAGQLAWQAFKRASVLGAVGGTVSWVSWNVMMADGCGACGEEEPYLDWEIGLPDGALAERCVPPKGEESEREDNGNEDDESISQGDDLPDPDRPRFGNDGLDFSGWGGAEDMAGCPLNGSSGDWGQGDDDGDDECYELQGASCNPICPPFDGFCPLGCDTCGACIYGPC